MSKELFRDDAYLKQCEAKVTFIDNNKIGLDQTVFYPMGGGQPGDSGEFVRVSGEHIVVFDTIKDSLSNQIWHITKPNTELEIGETVVAKIDWARRYKLMRLHSCMHMLCAIIPASVTGGAIRGSGSARLDFDLPEPLDKEQLNDELSVLCSADHPMTSRWIANEEMQATPALIRTMSVNPPMGVDRVRLVEFKEVDLQPCGGTHVANSNEIGPVSIQSIKKKGRLNRRVTVVLG